MNKTKDWQYVKASVYVPLPSHVLWLEAEAITRSLNRSDYWLRECAMSVGGINIRYDTETQIETQRARLEILSKAIKLLRENGL